MDDDSSTILNQPTDSSYFQYVVNDYMTVYVTISEYGCYNCYIKENFYGKEQVCYLKLDDASKYNYIPNYDSLEYDLNLTFDDTEYLGKKVSSKYKLLPTLRRNSVEYQQLIASCDDINELSNFYQKSFYFQAPDSVVSKQEKIDVLVKLIEITQIQLVDMYLNEYRDTKNIIVLGWISILNSYNLIKFVKPEHNQIIYSFRKNSEMVDYSYADWILEKYEQLKSNLESYNYLKKLYSNNKTTDDYVKKLIQSKRLFPYSKYILDIQNDNLTFINNNRDNIYKEIEKCNLFICADYKNNISRLFFFTINFSNNNNVVLTKNFYNKEFLPTTRISNYYLYY